MARKSAVLLKSTPVKLPKLSRQLLAWLEKHVAPDKTEDQWRRYLVQQRELEELWTRYDELAKVVDKRAYNHPDWPAFVALGKEIDRKQRQMFAAFDGYNYAVKHKDDKINAPMDDVSAIVNDSLKGNIENMQFTNNHGLLAHHVAQAITAFTSEESAGEPPLCHECG